MKVFWSWQSDTPGKTGRHFVRKALENAIDQLQVEKDSLDEPDRPETEGLHLDHDRKNLRGSPDLFPAIHDKIRKAAVFIGDVTPVAKTDGGKQVMNPNVAIELGIALEAIGTDSVLFVMNTAYGDRAAMPFDLAHKSGPIMYHLPEAASAADIAATGKKLSTELKECIRPYFEAFTPKPALFELGEWEGKSTFAKGAELIVIDTYRSRSPTSIKLQSGGCIFLRVFPRCSIPALTVDQLVDLFGGVELRVIAYDVSMSWGRTADGFVVYAVFRDGNPCRDYVKVFTSGEIWAVLHHEPVQKDNSIPLEYLINLLARGLDDYTKLLERKLVCTTGFGFVVGITGIEDKHVLDYFLGVKPVGKGLVPAVILKGEKTPNQTAAQALQSFATQAWQAFGLSSKPIEPIT